MNSITEYESCSGNKLKKTNTLTLKSHLSLNNLKSKYKKNHLRSESFQKYNETCEQTGISRINSINQTNTPLSTSPNKRPKGRVCFAPKFRLINYIYYNPNEIIHKEENEDEKKEIKTEAKINNEQNRQVREATDKVDFQCTCLLM